MPTASAGWAPAADTVVTDTVNYTAIMNWPGGVPTFQFALVNDAHTGNVISCNTTASAFVIVLFGVLLGMLSTVIVAIGQNLLHDALKEPDCAPLAPHLYLGACTTSGSQRWRPSLCLGATANSRWRRAFCMILLGTVGTAIATAFASTSRVLLPLASLQFATNVLYARWVGNIDVTSRMYAGCALAMVGAVLMGVNSPSDIMCFDVNELQAAWSATAWLAFVGVVGGLSIVGLAVHHHLTWKPTLSASSTDGQPFWRPILLATSSAGLIGCQAVTHTKGMTLVLDMVGTGQYDLDQSLFPLGPVGPILDAEIVASLLSHSCWLVQLNHCLALYPGTWVLPLLQASYLAFGSLNTSIFLRQTLDAVSAAGWFNYLLGIALLAAGALACAPLPPLAALLTGNAKETPPTEESPLVHTGGATCDGITRTDGPRRGPAPVLHLPTDIAGSSPGIRPPPPPPRRASPRRPLRTSTCAKPP